MCFRSAERRCAPGFRAGSMRCRCSAPTTKLGLLRSMRHCSSSAFTWRAPRFTARASTRPLPPPTPWRRAWTLRLELTELVSTARPDRASMRAMPSAFSWSSEPEPHAERRRRMLQSHPQIKQLYGPCPRTKYVCSALVLAQLGLAYELRAAPWWLILLVAYAVGGLINQALLLAIHELSHNLAFRRPWHNRAFALFINLPVGVPVAETFRYYHLLHHTQQ